MDGDGGRTDQGPEIAPLKVIHCSHQGLYLETFWLSFGFLKGDWGTFLHLSTWQYLTTHEIMGLYFIKLGLYLVSFFV